MQHLRRSGPYLYSLALVIYMPLGLYWDAHLQTLGQQYLLGLLNLGVLLLAIHFSPPQERLQVWIVVAVATAIECFNTFIWGVYTYRFHNVPLYVPTGHGLVYLFALRSARTPLLRAYGKQAARLALLVATAWAIAGITVQPLLFGRMDLAGALLLPVIAWFVLRQPAPVYASAFLIASALELFGTGFGNWTWAASTPFLHIPSGNPPSAIAAVYCLLDALTLRLGTVIPLAWMALPYSRTLPAERVS